jgi:hypothetical protein
MNLVITTIKHSQLSILYIKYGNKKLLNIVKIKKLNRKNKYKKRLLLI